MTIQHLKYFVKVAETCHFTRAAETLYVSQPTLSQQIRQLEKEIGTPLFDRVGKRVQLTAAGRLFRDYALRAVREMEDAKVALGELDGLERGEVRVGVVQTVNAYLIPAIIGRFTRAHSKVALYIEELSANEIEAGILEGHLGLGIGFVPTQLGGIESHPLFEEDFVLAVSANHRLNKRSHIQMHELDGEPLVLLSTAFCTRRLFDESAHAAHVRPQVIVEMNSIEGIIATVRASHAATVLPELALQGERNSGKANALCPIALVNPTPRRMVGLMWRSNTYRCSATRALAEDVFAVIKDQMNDLRLPVEPTALS